MTDPAEPTAASERVPAPQRSEVAARLRPNLLALGALAVGAIALWQWYSTQGELDRLREEFALRLRDADAEARASRLTAKDAESLVREADKRLDALEAKVGESQSQQLALEAMYQELSRGRDDWVLAEIDQTLSIAARELQLAGNVPAALAALSAAEARLARVDRAQYPQLRKAIARDAERLRAAPSLDISGLTAKLDQLAASVDALPLLAEGRPQPEKEPAGGPEPGWWVRFGTALWGEVKSLVRVQRLDAQDQALVSPDQAWFLRENLKLRLAHARVALLQRNESAYRADIRAATQWISRYFDPRDKRTIAALATLKQLEAATVSVELPSIAESLAAVRALRTPRERAGK
ncbi:MAG: uroporphyrinogen-III C-methyltransferase [Burkholderiales bacterium]|jgi:uroporphyrin-3 C-methyltransferase|nr:uroporphyrinogen-III C-methyltransferase [Burkholderiales bacterium]